MKTNGPGKYNDLCTYVREQSDAEMAVVIVVRGNKGNGFDVQTVDTEHLRALPGVLMEMALGIRQEIEDDEVKP